jgi:hypothetical protein
LPELFTAVAPATPPVGAAFADEGFEMSADSLDPAATEPRPDDHRDRLPFDPARPSGPYLLTQMPLPGPRRVRLATPLGDTQALTPKEVVFDPDNARRFTLQLKPHRDLSSFNGVDVLYSVTAVYVQLKYNHDASLTLTATGGATLARAEALAVTLLTLRRDQMIADAERSFASGDYGAVLRIKTLQLTRGTDPLPGTRRLLLRAEMELKGTRSLAVTEGRPIVHIRTPGRPLDPSRAVGIEIDVEA